MFGALKNLATGAFSDVKAMAARYNDKPFLKGVIAMGLKLAYADGELEASEKQKLMKIMEIRPELGVFSPMDKASIFKEGNDIYEVDVDMGNEWADKAILAAAANNPERAKVLFIVGVAVAKADGEVEPAEQVVLDQVSRSLGVTL